MRVYGFEATPELGDALRHEVLGEVCRLAEYERREWDHRTARLHFGPDPLALKVNSGNDLQAQVMGGGVYTTPARTSTGATATTLTDTGAAFPTAGNGLAGQVVVVADATTSAYGVITSNTATVLTVDKWTSPADPTVTATTPAAASRYVVVPGGQPAFWMAITTDAAAPAAGDTTLATELTNTGLARKPATYSHTAGAASYALSATFTNPDTTPRVINKLGIFNTGPAVGGRMVFETLVPNPPTLASASDTITPTDTVSL